MTGPVNPDFNCRPSGFVSALASRWHAVVDAAQRVAGKLILDALDKLNDLKIAQGYGGLVGLVVKRAARQVDHVAPVGWNRPRAADDGVVLVVSHEMQARLFFDQIELHRELPDPALQGCDFRFVVGRNSCRGLFIDELAAVELRQPHLDEVGRQGVLPLGITPTHGWKSTLRGSPQSCAAIETSPASHTQRAATACISTSRFGSASPATMTIVVAAACPENLASRSFR